MRYKFYGKGWYGESYRHSLASKGVRSKYSWRVKRIIPTKLTPTRLEEIDSWIKGNESMSRERLSDSLIKRFGLTEMKADEMIARHQLFESGKYDGRGRISVAGKLNGKKVAETNQGIPITIRNKAGPGREYPVTPSDIKRNFNAMEPEIVDGIKEVNFRDPGIPATKQDKAWAQYVRSDQRVNIFSQPQRKGRFDQVDPGLESPEKAKHYMMSYVVPHEVAHHYLQHNLKLDQDTMLIEEARADAMTFGKNPLDSVVVERFKRGRQSQFGPKGTI